MIVERDVAVGAGASSCACGTTSLSANLRISSRIDFERLVEAAVADRRVRVASRISSTRRARRRAVLPDAISSRPRTSSAPATSAAVKPEIGQAHDLALAHRECRPAIWARYSPSPMRDEQFFDLAEVAGRSHPLGIGGELAHRLDIGREPGEAVGGALLAVEQTRRPCRHRRVTRARTAAAASASTASTAARWRRAPRATRSSLRREMVGAAQHGRLTRGFDASPRLRIKLTALGALHNTIGGLLSMAYQACAEFLTISMFVRC